MTKQGDVDPQDQTQADELEKALLGFKGGYGGHSLSSLMNLIDSYANQRALELLGELEGFAVEPGTELNHVTNYIHRKQATIAKRLNLTKKEKEGDE